MAKGFKDAKGLGFTTRFSAVKISSPIIGFPNNLRVLPGRLRSP
jgi:hypothetical protein